MDYASILVVDDDEMIVHFFKMVLEEKGYNVSEAFNGRQAINQATTTPVDLVILDYKLPDMTGDKVALRLKELNNESTIVFVTGYSDAKDKILGSNLSRHVVVKPIREEELIETVERGLIEKKFP